MRSPVVTGGDNAHMHNTPRPSEESAIDSETPLEDLIAELSATDPAAGPDIADEIAVRLEADLAAARGRAHPSETAPEED
jgi:hypothetical protein